MIEIKITAETGDEAREKLLGLLAPRMPLMQSAGVRIPSGPDGLPTVPSAYAADTALPQAAQDAKVYTEAQTEARKTRGRPKKAEAPAPAISTTPEHRVDPADEAQDAADEADEAAAEPAKVLTADDLRAAAKVYIDKFGMALAQEDGPKIMVDALGAPPAGNDGWTISLAVQSGQETAAKAVEAWTRAGAAEARYGTR